MAAGASVKPYANKIRAKDGQLADTINLIQNQFDKLNSDIAALSTASTAATAAIDIGDYEVVISYD